MASFEEDLEYAKKIELVYQAAVGGGLALYPGIWKKRSSDSLEYYNFIDEGSDKTFAYIEQSPGIYSNLYNERDFLFDYRSNVLNLTLGNVTPRNTYTLEFDEMSEEWYFQQSLVLEPSVLRAFVVFYTLKKNYISDYSFQLHPKYLDKIVAIMERHQWLHTKKI